MYNLEPGDRIYNLRSRIGYDQIGGAASSQIVVRDEGHTRTITTLVSGEAVASDILERGPIDIIPGVFSLRSMLHVQAAKKAAPVQHLPRV